MAETITVVVPTLNSDRTLEWTLCSLATQQRCQPTVVVVDSGSTDATLEICHRYGVRVIYVPPGNMYQAINAGMKTANTGWVTYLNSDDLVYPFSYARLMKLGEETHSDVVYGSCDFVDWEGRFVHSYTPGYPRELLSQFLHSQLSFAQPAAIFTRHLFDELGGFSEEYKLASDLDFFLRAVLAKKRFSMLTGSTVACFRIHQKQASQNIEKLRAETKDIQNRHVSSDRSATFDTLRWRIRNIPNYLVRILRHWSLSGRLRIVRTLHAGDETY